MNSISAYPLIFLLTACIYSTLGFAQQKHALIIAVGEYDKNTSGFNPISSANDVPLISAALVSQGFVEQDITVLQDEKATRAGIVAALADLEKRTKAGDIVVIHYSGHGQQITDNNGDEIDGYDEAMVPYDAQARFKKGVYEGENHLRDDEIGEWLQKIRKKAGPNGNVLLIMDSCHSGTASRGLTKARGTQEVFNTGQAPAATADNESGLFGLEEEDPDANLAPLVCIYGASAHELNYEAKDQNGKGVGSLSLAFSDAFATAPANQSYEELFDRIKNKMAVLAPRQTPQAEGDLNRMLLGGNIAGKKTYFTVLANYDNATVTINGGALMGIYEGSKMKLYPLGAEPTEENIIAFGVVSFADATTADIDLADVKADADLNNAKAYVSEVNYGKMQVKVAVNLSSPELKAALLEEFKGYPLVNVVADNADLFIEDAIASRGAEVQLITNQEYIILQTVPENVAETAKELTRRVLGYAQANFLRNINMTNEDLDLQFEFVPITAKQVGRGRWQEDTRVPLSDKQDVSGNINFQGGDFFKIKVVNNGFEVAYFTILDFQPDNQINVLLPGKTKKPADYVLKPGEERELPDVFRFGPPYGTEVFMLVATKSPIDFRSILVNRGQTRGEEGGDNPFAELVAGTFKEDSGTRGPETMNVAAGSCNIYSVTFTISKAP